MEAAGLPHAASHQIETAPTRMDACLRSGDLFALDPVPTAAVCYNDAVALGV